jgi:hypothetical protein
LYSPPLSSEIRFPPNKRRISYSSIKSTTPTDKHLRKLDLPMKRCDWVRVLLQGRDKSGELVPRCRRSAEPALDLGAPLLARFWFILREERRDHRVADQADVLDPLLQRTMPRFLDGARGLDFGAGLHRFGDAILHHLPEQR